VKLRKQQVKMERPPQEKVTRAQALKRVKACAKRKEQFVAAIRH
jgi:hypothetical protein